MVWATATPHIVSAPAPAPTQPVYFSCMRGAFEPIVSASLFHTPTHLNPSSLLSLKHMKLGDKVKILFIFVIPEPIIAPGPYGLISKWLRNGKSEGEGEGERREAEAGREKVWPDVREEGLKNGSIWLQHLVKGQDHGTSMGGRGEELCGVSKEGH